ncbi:hypothetical protein Tco_0201560 [Tanacetum coccineum]
MATPFANPERQFRARRDTSPAPIHNIYTFYESESSESESEDVGEIDIKTLTLEQYLTLNNTRRRISNPENATFEIKGQFLRVFRKTTFSGSSTKNAIEHIGKVLEVASLINTNDSALLRVFPLTLVGVAKIWLTASKALKSIQELVVHSHKWHNEESKNTSTPFGIIAEKLKALNHEMDELRVDVRKINMNGEMKSLHEEIKSIRTSKVSYNKSSPKSNIHPTNLKDTFEHYLKESRKRQDVLNEWMKKFMINTEINLKNHDSSIKRLEENVNHLVQLISTHNLTNQECAIKLEPASEKPTLKVETFAEKVKRRILKENRRPMLATAYARIDVFGKKISLEVGTEQITFDINEREFPAVISAVFVINNLSEINEFDEPRDLEDNSSISVDDFVEMDDVWDNLDFKDLTNEANRFLVKP